MITSHYHKDVRGYLNRNLPQRWIGHTGKEDDALMRWPPPSPDLTSRDFFFWGFVKDTVFVPPLPANHQIFATVSPLLWLWSAVTADTRVERDGLSHRRLSYYQMWTHWASAKYVKKAWRVSLSVGVRTVMIRWVVYLLRIFKMFHGLMNKPVFACSFYLLDYLIASSCGWCINNNVIIIINVAALCVVNLKRDNS